MYSSLPVVVRICSGREDVSVPANCARGCGRSGQSRSAGGRRTARGGPVSPGAQTVCGRSGQSRSAGGRRTAGGCPAGRSALPGGLPF
jgi:hypothetical protein